MDFRVTEDQAALQEGIRSFCEGRVPVDALGGMEKQPLDRELHGELAEMGVFGLRLEESEGGVGLGMSEAALVFAELGRRLVTGPLIWSHLAAGLVDGAGSGECVVTGLDRTRASNEPILLEYLEGAGSVLVLEASGVRRIDAAAIEARAIATPLDPLTPLHHAAALPEGESIGDAALSARLRREGAILSAAMLLGVCESTLELAVAYGQQREQFGRPIGGFQAIKHILADMYVRQEQVRSAVYAAAATADGRGVGDVDRAVATAKLLAGEFALKNARACVQVYGGMGFTWEMPPHYYLKRVFVLQNAFGSADEHALTVGEGLEGDAG
ncbi:MAG: acyl-CoA dehydrogenase family protein [Myxococcota bacterium]|nr:acyl-CoA dehydrogenase family protein [Myxococcota bacterium]